MVKYYLIDAEILFSRSPFVLDQVEEFSFVRPYHVLCHKSQDKREVIIPMPDNILGKNVVIEINSEEL